jgi:hypothetical protein
MGYPFGQNITYWFYPLLDNDTAVVPSAVQSQTPAIYVFDESVPSRGDAASGANSLQTVSTWVWSSQKKAWSLTIQAINDPHPDSNIPTRTYWVALNFRLQSAGQVQTVIKPLQLERVVGHDKVVSVTEEDLRAYFPQIDAYSSDVQRKAFISQALIEIKGELRAKGYEWAKITRADRLDLCVIYKALSMVMVGQIQEPGDKFSIKYQEYKSGFQSNLDSLKFEYQQMEGGIIETGKGTATIIISR